MGARNFMDDNDSFYKAVSQRTDIDKNSFDIIGHGTPNTIVMTINGKIVEVDHRMVARILQHSPDYHGQNIRLLSCNTGALSDGFAQNLANKLGVTVEAPSNFLWADKMGNMFIAGMKPNRSPDFGDIGKWLIFKP